MKKTHYHFVGIGGAGMSALARIYAMLGYVVSGSDMADSATLNSLTREFGITTSVGHRAENVEGADLVISTAAVRGANPEIDAAEAVGIPVITRAECLGRLMTHYPRSVAVSGTHGKTTTSGMISQMLAVAQADPTAVIGGDVPEWSSNARIGGSDIFVAEACEAYGSFFELHPAISVITNVESDHLDYYKNMDSIRDAFRRLLGQTSYYSVICADDPEAAALAAEIEENVATYGVSTSASVRAVDIRLGAEPTYTVEILGNILGTVELSVPGHHNVVNSLAAVTVGNLLDIPFEAIARGLKAFTGTGRRFERLGTTDDGIVVVDDYAHHPTEIVATLSAARSAYPDRRIIAVFQPHLPSRTKEMMDEFASAFQKADLVVLTEIYLSREKAMPCVTGAVLAERTAKNHSLGTVLYVQNKSDIPEKLAEISMPGDLIVTLGAGDIRIVSERFLALYARPERFANV